MRRWCSGRYVARVLCIVGWMVVVWLLSMVLKYYSELGLYWHD